MKMKENAVARNRNDVALENNFMFTTVMKNKKACIKLMETIFGDEHRIADIRYARHPEAEKSILSDPMRRGVRLDVYFDDGKTVYDIELQRTSITDLAQRARLYSSSMDVAMLDKGEGFGSMRTSYVIFLCTFDPFSKDEKVYRFSTMCEDVQGLPLGDGRCIMFLNTRGSVGELGADMDAFFEYLNGGIESIGKGRDSGNEFVERLDECVLDINGDEDWRQGYMKYELNLIEKYKEGEANERNRMVRAIHLDGVPMEKIYQYASIPVEQIESILKSCPFEP